MSKGLEDVQLRIAAPKPVAVIDIGTTSIRMAIAEIDEQGSARVLETLQQAVGLGKDTFTNGRIGKATIEECVKVLRSYRQMLTEYKIVLPEQIRVVATSAVREASNRLAFIDRIYIATGLQIEPIDEAEETRITYLGILPHLRSEPALTTGTTIVIEMGGGSTELLVVRDRNVLYANSYRLGSLRLRETLEAYNAPTGKVREFMESQIERTVDQILEHVTPEESSEMIALGSDMRFATHQLVPDWNPKQLARVPLAELEQFTDRIVEMSEDELVRKYAISYPDADSVGPALLTYVQLARAFKRSHVLVTNTNLRDGLLKAMATDSIWTEEFSNQIIRSAEDLGRRFHFDEPHAQQVADTARQLFNQLRSQHQLDHRYAVILYIAALLHEIGLFVGFASHHKHSMYLIRNSELFGLGRKEILLTALVARYYRRASPQPGHEGYSALDRDERVAVSKLAAILRIAVALSDSRSQRIDNIRCETQGNRLVISVPNVQDISLEQLALRQNASLFEDVFGLQVQLRTLRDEAR
ncbi:MAG: Ppx/GppA family phosphatase [Planctomycetes bacterium]|nr:Ppx/GppA family phosphatase [Planctomycetota bacterium]